MDADDTVTMQLQGLSNEHLVRNVGIFEKNNELHFKLLEIENDENNPNSEVRTQDKTRAEHKTRRRHLPTKEGGGEGMGPKLEIESFANFFFQLSNLVRVKESHDHISVTIYQNYSFLFLPFQKAQNSKKFRSLNILRSFLRFLRCSPRISERIKSEFRSRTFSGSFSV